MLIADVRIEVHLILIADRAGLQEPAQYCTVDAGLVVAHAKVGDSGLPGIFEPPAICYAGIAWAGNAILVSGVDRGCGAFCVGDQNAAARMIGVHEPELSEAAA
jgi:hypothetical protein